MIQAQELRLNNLISFPFISQEVEVIGIALHDSLGLRIQAKGVDGSIYFEPIEVFDPIPLTEEWLLKLGYNGCSIRHNHYVIKGHTIWLCQEMFLCDKNGIIIKHVHQLQNLYFALTNTELTSK